MTITIAGKSLPTRRPQDLNAVLIAATGCSAAENRKIIDGTPLPGRLAAALHPFLTDGPSVAELAAMVEIELARADNRLVADVRKLFDNADVAAPADTKVG